jgi:hypothetical protein
MATPGYRAIADFRKNNAAGLQAANREFVRLARSLDLLGGELVAIDSAYFHGDASKASILSEKRLEEQMAVLDRSIAEYAAALEANDQVEAAPSGQELAQKLESLRGRRAKPISPSSRTAAMASSRAPTWMLACSPSTGKSSPATMCRSQSTTSTS